MSADWGDLEADAGRDDRLVRMGAERDRLARQLHDVKHRQADYLETVRQAVEDAVGRIEIAPVPSNVLDYPTGEREEYAVALLSDLQTGKITPDYNSDTVTRRVQLYADKVIELARIQ